MLPYYIHSPKIQKWSIPIHVFLSRDDKDGSNSATDQITDKAGQIP